MKTLHGRYDLSVILPTYNEKENILIILDRINKVLKDESYQIIVVDDNSPDGTWEIAQHYAKKHPNIQVIRRLKNKGLSSAILEGFGSSNSQWMVAMDADLQHDEKILINFLAAFRKGNDIVIGSRKSAGGSIPNWNIFRRLVSWVATIMAFLIIKNNISDPMSGFFGISREVLEKNIHKINPRGFKLLLEILAYNPGSKIFEIGYTFNKRLYGKSKLSTNVILDYLAAFYELSLGRYIPIRFVKFSIVGITGLLILRIIQLGGSALSDETPDYIIYLGSELAILNNYFFNNRWTFKDYRHRNAYILSGLMLFHVVCLAGLVINYAIINLLVNRMSFVNPLAVFLGMMFSTIWNYRINFQITWKKEI